MSKLLTIDHENSGEAFWDHLTPAVIKTARISDEARSAAAVIARPSCKSVEVPDEVAAEVLAWFATLPGWTGGPAHAPHPVLMQDCE